MFSATENKLDMFEAMQSGKVVLVNTSKSLLKSDASALFGRYMIALVIRAVYERVATADRHPAFLIVDEASEYFDDNIQTLLEQARKFNVGLVLAHQHLDQLSMGQRSRRAVARAGHAYERRVHLGHAQGAAIDAIRLLCSQLHDERIAARNSFRLT
jgi:predicted ABC-type transport system involved in lysophospholipase L1 biosynthesis ATPase subunit